MKRLLPLFLAVTAGFALVLLVMARNEAAKREAADAALASRQAAWNAERKELEMAVRRAKSAPPVERTVVETEVREVPVATRVDARQLVARLEAIRVTPGPGYNGSARQVIHVLESLIEAGPEALPAIRDFLLRNAEVDYEASGGSRGSRDIAALTEFLVPPSMRFGLFDAVRRIGGPQAEQLFAEILGTTARGAEVAYLAHTLQQMAPGKYREEALAAARELLNHPVNVSGASALDRRDRDYLFGVLALFGDASYTSQAQAQLVQADGQVDRAALNYLQQVAGPQSIAMAAQAYQDTRFRDAASKEPLARLVLSFVGADQQANQFYETTINDPGMPAKARKNLIEDLNEDGLNYKHLTAADLPIIQNRLALIEQLAPRSMDQANAAAFKEAYKDLLKMREKAMAAK